MNRQEFNKHVEHVFERTANVLLKKGNEYSKVENVFHNFENATGISLHDEPTSVAWEFLVKHLQSIKDMLIELEATCLKPKFNEEVVEEKFGDAINYLILIEGMLMQKLKENAKVKPTDGI